MYCKNCGKKLENTASFCVYCGTKQSDIPPTNQQQTYTPYTNQQQYYVPQPDRQMYSQPMNVPTANASQTKKNWALGISITTIPLLFIIRMLALEKGEIRGFSWTGEPYYNYFVPDNIKAIMFILLLASMVFSIGFGVGGKPKNVAKSIIIAIMSLLNMFVGFYIIVG